MLEFYLWPHGARIALVMLAIAVALVQTAVLLLSVSRLFVSKGYGLRALGGAAGLAEAFCIIALLAQVQQAAIAWLPVRPGYVWLRWGVAAAAVTVAAFEAAARRSPAELVAALPAALVAPALERPAGAAYPWLILAALLLLVACGLRFMLQYRISSSDTPSSLSVKEAIDRLRTGILFGRPNGHIVLKNRRMHLLMLALTGSEQRNGNTFYDMLKAGRCRPDCRRESAGDQLIYSLPDGSVWLFRLDELTLRRRKYFQLSAGDITEYWRTGISLQKENEELALRSAQLRQTLSELRSTCRREEHRRAQLRVHDVLGQKISLLLRTIQQYGEADAELLEEFAGGLPKELRSASEEQAAQSELDVLGETMATIGVSVSVKGKLPEDGRAGAIFADICTEAATNAVRHGFADEIAIVFTEDERQYTLNVSDNGCSVQEGAQEGGGIRGMREKLAECGGTLEISAEPLFTVTARIPRACAETNGG